MPTDSAILHTDRDAGVATLTLNRPERGNALSTDLVEALIEGVHTAMTDGSVHTLVLRGQGRRCKQRHFSSQGALRENRSRNPSLACSGRSSRSIRA
jgi:enoyl-CoA hydratase/carnithine racemase